MRKLHQENTEKYRDASSKSSTKNDFVAAYPLPAIYFYASYLHINNCFGPSSDANSVISRVDLVKVKSQPFEIFCFCSSTIDNSY